MSDAEPDQRRRPITATEVARKLLDRPAGAESITTKHNAKLEVQVELATVRQKGESMMEWASRHATTFDFLQDYYREQGLPDRGEHNGD